jgi:hypothetical protein
MDKGALKWLEEEVHQGTKKGGLKGSEKRERKKDGLGF